MKISMATRKTIEAAETFSVRSKSQILLKPMISISFAELIRFKKRATLFLETKSSWLPYSAPRIIAAILIMMLLFSM